MILQKLASAIRRQDWFQVIIEIFIVVIGIFLGLQVTEWNEEREEQVQEQRILASLKSDVDNLLLEKVEALNRMKNQIKYLSDALSIIFDKTEVDTLLDDQCTGVWRSHIISWEMSPLITVDELISSGNLNIINNENLRTKIMEYRSLATGSFIANPLANRGTVVLVDDYPNILVRTRYNNQNRIDCNLELIRKDQGFLNGLQSNFGRKNGVLIRAEEETALLKEVSDLLMKEQKL